MEDRTGSRPTSNDIAYIYHVIGTLNWSHIVYSLESLKNQEIHWKAFILYNASPFNSEEIMQLVPKHMFDEVKSAPYDFSLPKSAVADWNYQIKNIGGYDRYFVHKADFYLSDKICKSFEEINEPSPFLAMFHKFDMKEKSTPDLFRKYASLSWDEAMKQDETGDYYGEHIGRLAIPFRQVPGQMDGVMHGYSDSAREYYSPDEEEIKAPWGGTKSFDKMSQEVDLITDDKLFALHMYHYTPHRIDPVKLTEGERF